MAVEDVAIAVFLRRRLEIGIIVAATRLGIGECEDTFPADDGRKVFLALGVAASMLEEAAGADHGGNERFDHQALAEFFHDDHRVDRAAAKTADIFAEGHAQNAEFGELRPDFGAPSGIALDSSAARFPIVLFTDQARKTVAHHVLFFGEVEIHVSSLSRAVRRSQSPRIIFVMMLR